MTMILDGTPRFTRLDQGFECERFSIRAFASVGFAHANLLDGKPQVRMGMTPRF